MNASEQDRRARERATLIVQVQNGRLTAVEAARRLGVSRKTYYKWEQRALEAMVSALRDKMGGRPAEERDAEKERLQGEVQNLQEALTERDLRERIQTVLKNSKEAGTAEEKKRSQAGGSHAGPGNMENERSVNAGI
jgi:transposase